MNIIIGGIIVGDDTKWPKQMDKELLTRGATLEGLFAKVTGNECYNPFYLVWRLIARLLLHSIKSLRETPSHVSSAS